MEDREPKQMHINYYSAYRENKTEMNLTKESLLEN